MRSYRIVAIQATAIIAVIYLLASLVLNAQVKTRSQNSNKLELSETLGRLIEASQSVGSGPSLSTGPAGETGPSLSTGPSVGSGPSLTTGPAGETRPAGVGTFGGISTIDPDEDLEQVPVAYWWVSRNSALPNDKSIPKLPKRYFDTTQAIQGMLGGSEFTIAGASVKAGRWVVAISDAGTIHDTRVLEAGELILLPVVLGVFFVFSYLVGRRAVAPIDESRKRLLTFTADASHELRTPISVIEAEVGSALMIERDAKSYREVLTSVSQETRRLSTIVEELLWLARFDSSPQRPSFDLVDLSAMASSCARRFSTIAQGKGITIQVDELSVGAATINAPPEWLDRLITTLVDNACKYGPENSTVKIEVGGKQDYGPYVAVHDQGPGISETERERIFERFHRANEYYSGTGLGLAIADAVVKATGGHWEVGSSPLGGAKMKVSW